MKFTSSVFVISHVSSSSDYQDHPDEAELGELELGPGVGDGQLLLLAPDDVDVDGGGADVVRQTSVHSRGIVSNLTLKISFLKFLKFIFHSARIQASICTLPRRCHLQPYIKYH